MITPDFPKTEPGYAWFRTLTASSLVLAPRKKDLPKHPGFTPARVQIGSFRFRKWGLQDPHGRFLTQSDLNAPPPSSHDLSDPSLYHKGTSPSPHTGPHDVSYERMPDGSIYRFHRSIRCF